MTNFHQKKDSGKEELPSDNNNGDEYILPQETTDDEDIPSEVQRGDDPNPAWKLLDDEETRSDE